MKIKDLKVGDRVRFKDKIAYCGTTTFKEITQDGVILEIHGSFYQISDEYNWWGDKQSSVKKENIISKLELLPAKYKEIPIEKEIKLAPKSFKFDISHVRRVEFNQLPFTPDSFGECYFRIDGVKIAYHPDNPQNFPEAFNGREYTVEIKEKK